MAYDDTVARILRESLAELCPTEKKMFGGLCLLHRGHMIAGAHAGGAMVRVGKQAMDNALAIPGVTQMWQGNLRPMAGMVTCGADVLADPTHRRALLDLAQDFNRTLPAK